jgi:hypothetical protein
MPSALSGFGIMIPALIASGSVDHAAMTAFWPESKQTVSDSASPEFGD